MTARAPAATLRTLAASLDRSRHIEPLKRDYQVGPATRLVVTGNAKGKVTFQVLLETVKSLPAQQRAEVEDFVEFLAAKAKKRAAWDRLLAIAPALEAAGVAPMS